MVINSIIIRVGIREIRMLEWTGERYLPFVDPKISGAEIHYEHLHRYYFASQFIEGKSVLDLGCGEGYGSYILSKSAAHVIGLDIDEKTVKHASSKYIKDNLEFIQGSVLKVPIKDKLFDVIVCFELLEHIEDHNKLLSEIKRLLKDDGFLLISTPNKKIYSDERNYKNLFHKKELYFDEFKELLRKYFRYTHFFGQRVYAGSNLWSLVQAGKVSEEYVVKRGGSEFFITSYEMKDPMYFVAIASDRNVKISLFRSYLIDADDNIFNNFRMNVQTLEVERSNLLEQLNKVKAELAERDLRLQTLEVERSNLLEQLNKVKAELADIKDSFGYSLMRFYTRILHRLMPDGTKRGELRKILVASVHIIKREGLRSLCKQALEKIKKREFKIIESTQAHEALVSLRREIKESQLDSIERMLKLRLELFLSQPNTKLSFPNYKDPLVSIIIPTFNKAEYLYQCLESILVYTDVPYELIVVDDCSQDLILKLLEKCENIKIVRNAENYGFVESCNRGAKASKGVYLVFLNNDVIVTRNWLNPLVKTIKRDNVGAIGVKLVYPDGKLQEAGAIVWKDGSAWNYGRYDDPNKPEYNFVREVDYCSGAALLVRKDLFEKIGGFDRRFSPGYYEDTDLCFSIRKLGYKVLYQPESIIIHFEGVTSGTNISSGIKRYQEINKHKFYEKWKEVLKEHYDADPENLFCARSRSCGKNILVIDHYVPEFDKDSGSCRMFHILKILTELGHKVTFIGDNLLKSEPYTEILQQCGVEVQYAPYIRSVEEFLIKNGKYFDIVILSRAHIADKHILMIKKYCTKAKVIFDTVDLWYLREMRRAKVEGDEKLLKKAMELKSLEFRLAKMSNLTIVTSPAEKEIIMREDPSIHVKVIPNIHEVNLPKKGFFERNDLMFLGGFAHPPNVDAIKHFLREVFPIIKRKIPNVKLYVVGSNPPKEIKKLSSIDVIVTGYVEDLSQYFESCRVFIAPLRYGAGLKGKIGESMAHGLPVVTTSIGAEGMELNHGENALIADEPEEFAKCVITLYSDKELWDRISKNSIRHVEKNYSINVVKEQIRKILEEFYEDTLTRMKRDWNESQIRL